MFLNSAVCYPFASLGHQYRRYSSRFCRLQTESM